MPLQATSGAASYDAFGGGVPAEPNYIESVFSTFLYTGNDSTQTITNGIDLAGKGGLVWIKSRDRGDMTHALTDTVRGRTKYLATSSTAAQVTNGGGVVDVSSFNNNGFSLGPSSFVSVNDGGDKKVSWTFREQPKFFDVVTWTGDGSSNRQISHALGSVPGCIIVKSLSAAGNWFTYHRGLTPNPATKYVKLNSTDAVDTLNTLWNDTEPTSTVFTVGSAGGVNASGGTYVAYLFAHNAGGFGLTGTDNVISCGSYTGNGSNTGPVVTLGYEPQWLLIKQATTTGAFNEDWQLFDNMRGVPVGQNTPRLFPNTSSAEVANEPRVNFNATGFNLTRNDDSVNGSGVTYIYIAIRRGPMAVPTTGTSVFAPVTYSGDSSAPKTIGGSNIVSDIVLWANRFATTGNGTARPLIGSRLVGGNVMQTSSSTRFEDDYLGYLAWGRTQLGVDLEKTTPDSNETGQSYILYLMRRAPSCIDVVCYTGTGSNTTQTHNLGVVPELIIFKRRNAAGAWNVYSSALLNTEYLIANTTAAKATGATRWNSTTPTASVFSLGTESAVNASGGTYAAYLFATAAGVSKVGSYTGTATTLQIDCGFTGGARFVMIKRTDSTGDWYVWDSARGIVTGNDPYLLLNSTAAEVTNTDFVDTASTGFEISSTAPAAINASGGSFIFLAIA